MAYTKKQLKNWIKGRHEYLDIISKGVEEPMKSYYKGCHDELHVLENELDGLND